MASTACPACGEPVDTLRARVVGVVGGRVVAYCSVGCKQKGPTAAPPPEHALASRRPPWRWFAVASGGVVLVGVLLGARVSFDGRAATAALPTQPAPPAPVAAPAPPRPDQIPYGPDLPPAGLFAEGDSWFHPLPGPLRRLPVRPSQRFGAARDHDSPESCREGHCGCDLGEIKG